LNPFGRISLIVHASSYGDHSADQDKGGIRVMLPVDFRYLRIVIASDSEAIQGGGLSVFVVPALRRDP
jgi:hypothetical protein